MGATRRKFETGFHRWFCLRFCLRRGTFLPREKYPKARQPPSGWTPAVAQSVCIKFAAALPLKQQILRASDLGRAACPASAVALLKGEMHLSFCTARSAYQLEGRQAKCGRAPHRLRGASGPAEIQWQPCISPDGVRLDKNGGLGSPQRFFCPLLGVQKWVRRRQAV